MKARGNRSRRSSSPSSAAQGKGKKGLSARYIEEAVEASLKRLQTDDRSLSFAFSRPGDADEETLGASSA